MIPHDDCQGLDPQCALKNELEKEAERILIATDCDHLAHMRVFILEALRAVHNAGYQDGVQYAMNSERVLKAVRVIAFNEAIEKAVVILTGDVLETPDEFDGKTKLKVFALLDRMAAKMRTLKTSSEMGDSK